MWVSFGFGRALRRERLGNPPIGNFQLRAAFWRTSCSTRYVTNPSEAAVLPFTKRPARRNNETSHSIHTGEIEVLKGSAGSAGAKSVRPMPMPAPLSERPRVFARSSSDEDRTLLMSTKTKSSPPPAAPSRDKGPPTPTSVRPMPAPSLKGLMRQRQDDDERTVLRPSAPPAASRGANAVASAPRVSPAMLPTPYMPFKPPSMPPPMPAKPAAITGTVAAPRSAKHDSDARLDVPAAVITTRTRILRPKPTASWAAALVALGVFTGLVTAVVARGDADSLIDATASLVDPSQPQHLAAAGQPSAPTTTPIIAAANACGAEAPASTVQVSGIMVSNTPPVAVKAEPVAAIAPVAALPPADTAKRPEPPKPPPIAWAAPPRPAPQPVAAAPAPRPQAPAPQQVAAARPAPKPAAPAPAAAPAPKSAGSEMESATAADALAKAQLEASLR
jgi:hypothetical protein